MEGSERRRVCRVAASSVPCAWDEVEVGVSGASKKVVSVRLGASGFELLPNGLLVESCLAGPFVEALEEAMMAAILLFVAMPAP